jgi:hypothetical protein
MKSLTVRPVIEITCDMHLGWMGQSLTGTVRRIFGTTRVMDALCEE